MIRQKPVKRVVGAFALAGAIMVTGGAMVAQEAALPAEAPAAPANLDTPSMDVFPVAMSVCPNMAKLNRPETDENLLVTGYEPVIMVEGKVALAAAPVASACISSGFGPRRRGTHKGIDYFNRDPVDVYAAGTGIVKEMTYRDDFGNMLVIDHGDGVFTRYGHLQAFGATLAEGEPVKMGDVVGVMGNSASYRIARHLHYEVLTGEWGEQAGSFALTPVNVFALPGAQAGS